MWVSRPSEGHRQRKTFARLSARQIRGRDTNCPANGNSRHNAGIVSGVIIDRHNTGWTSLSLPTDKTFCKAETPRGETGIIFTGNRCSHQSARNHWVVTEHHRPGLTRCLKTVTFSHLEPQTVLDFEPNIIFIRPNWKVFQCWDVGYNQPTNHTQALHTDRINLSPFTKDFRVWGAPIET